MIGLLDGRRLIAVNNINWARVMAQIVYFFYAGLRLGAPEKAISFCVPSANFGHMFAGHWPANGLTHRPFFGY